MRQLKPCRQAYCGLPPTRKSKRNNYGQRVQEIEMAMFTPLVFSACGGMGPAATATVKRIASLLSEKWAQPYQIMCWLRFRYGFALIRASVMCLRGSRQHRSGLTRHDLALDEAHLSNNWKEHGQSNNKIYWKCLITTVKSLCSCFVS